MCIIKVTNQTYWWLLLQNVYKIYVAFVCSLPVSHVLSFYVARYIMCIKEQCTQQLVKNKINTNTLTFVFILLLTLHVLTLKSGHHQAYSDTSLSSWIASNSNMDPYCVLKSFKMYKSRAGRPEAAGVRVPVGSKNFHFYLIVQAGSGVHPTSYKMGTRVSFLGVKRQGREADHSPPTSAEVKKIWIYTSTALYVFMA
jgi:hypothetical protein